ncbi:hypothetical protein [Nocardia veterana]|uniref:Uncharacterized protein n=1 Tax=Nocardia veterana TaxID=132249 RepID=A0A7X6M0E0_9NOCA|nr:hypothetical protein [Nocardia veterana]NKY87984.1 hypothetical protein [Nocardia veterana]
MTAGSGTPMWVRALRVMSVLLGIAALVRERVRAVVTTAAPARHRPERASAQPTRRTSFGSA